jgi:hypothetical protein
MRYTTLLLLTLPFCAQAQNVGINTTGAAPATGAMLDVDATNRGVLIPRVALTAANNPNPVGAANVVESLLIYNTATAGTGVNAVTPGYYYWDGTRWVRVANGRAGWELLGNAGTNPDINFVGTTDNQALRFRTNNLERLEITTGTTAANGGYIRAYNNGVIGNATTGVGATPTYSFVSQPTTGIQLYQVSGVHALTFTTGGVSIRQRIFSGGHVVFNRNANLDPGDLVSAFAGGTLPYAISGYAMNAAGSMGVYGQSGTVANTYGVYGATGTAGAFGVYGYSNNAMAFPVYGYNTQSTGAGVVGNLTAATYGLYLPGSGGSFIGAATGVFGHGSTITTGYGLRAYGNGITAPGATPPAGGGGILVGNPLGVYGRAQAANSIGVLGTSNATAPFTVGVGAGGAFRGGALGALGITTTEANGTGVVGLGNAIGGAANPTMPVLWATGSGGAFVGLDLGSYSRANTVATGTGVVGTGNNVTLAQTFTNTNGGGGAFTGTLNGVMAVARGNTSTAVLGLNWDGAYRTNSFGVWGESMGTGSIGVVGLGNTDGVWGESVLVATGSALSGVGTRYGVWVQATNAANGMGVVAAGNGLAPINADDGSGGVFRGAATGLWGLGNAADATGTIGLGNGILTAQLFPGGSGVSGTGDWIGVAGYATRNDAVGEGDDPLRAGGYFQSGTGATVSYAYVAGYDNVPRKVTGNGTVNTIVDDGQGNKVLLSAPEAPENLFQDFGTGQLVNGRAHIDLDPIFARNIAVSEEHPLRVFIQLRGDCNGVYVTNETATGFDVVELMGGTSNAKFYWSVTANRANVHHADGTVWQFAEERFAPAPMARAVEGPALTEAELRPRRTPQAHQAVAASEGVIIDVRDAELMKDPAAIPQRVELSSGKDVQKLMEEREKDFAAPADEPKP